MKSRPSAGLWPTYRVAVRRWLQVKLLPADVRSGLVQQFVVWLALLVLLLWGFVGLVAAPLY